MAKRQSFADKVLKKKDVILCPACGNAVTFTKIVKSVPNDKGGVRMKSFTVGVIKCSKKDAPDCLAKKDNIITDKELQALS